MQEQTSALPSPHGPEQLCRNCETRPALNGYPTALCPDCRRSLIRYPIPKWIWIFAGGILLVMLIGLVQMPKYLSASVHLARGEKACDAHKYITAQRELEQVVAQFPNDVPANGRLMIAALHNRDFSTVARTNAAVEGKMIEDEVLLKEMRTTIAIAQWDMPTDTLLIAKFDALDSTPAVMENFFRQYDTGASGDGPYIRLLIANRLYEQKKYEQSAAVLDSVLQRRPDWPSALTLQSAVKRNMGDYDGALAICDRLLRRNREDVVVLAMKARTELKRKHDDAANRYATEAMRLQSDNIYAMEAMAMVNYYAGKGEESRRLLAQVQDAERNAGDSSVSQRLGKVIDGTEVYR